jgi:hypothetical protein
MRKLLLAPLLLGALASARDPRVDARDGAGVNPFAANALDGRARFSFEGVIEARLPAGSYVYLQVRDGAGARRWVATLAATAPAGARASVFVLARAERFRSRRLSREFSPLFFGAVRAAP